MASIALPSHRVRRGGERLPCLPLHPTSGMVDLNTLLPSGSGWTLVAGYAINDAGQITGLGFNSSNATTCFSAYASASRYYRPCHSQERSARGQERPKFALCHRRCEQGAERSQRRNREGRCTGTTTVTCNLGTIAAAGGASVSLVVHVTASAGSTISNTATVTAT